eukprot:TRINITY_DN170_c1_g1_i2.p1 TRINITY_DN170_c1_g1~~TRINITY_DN170_c1_g1_i2.p1  ORF type:complete len:534 (-),score=121.18 TRINITY_DN170_c1_g1_i2:4-1605(-)
MTSKVAAKRPLTQSSSNPPISSSPTSSLQSSGENDLFKTVEFNLSSKRDRVVDEILRTEQTYVKSLKTVNQLIKTPLIEAINRKDLSLEINDVRMLFSNIGDILRVNTDLLICLKDRVENWNSNPKIGDVLQQVALFLPYYSSYSLNFENSNTMLSELMEKKQFISFLESNKQNYPEIQQDISSYLIMPIQRIPRYRLLLEQLIECTQENHSDYPLLSEALDKLKTVAEQVNKAISDEEKRVVMVRVCKKFIDYKEKELIKKGRIFVHEGELEKICRKDRLKRRFFLFSDVLVYGTFQPPNKYKVARIFNVLEIKLKDLPDNNFKKQMNAIQFTTSSKSFIVLAETPEDKKQWIDVVQKTQTSFKQTVSDQPNYSNINNNSKTASPSSSAPVWVPDSEAKICKLCSTKFTFTNRRHHCRQCGDIVCGNCSNQKKYLSGQGTVRVCTECFKQAPELLQEEDLSDSSTDSMSEVEVIYELRALYDFDPPSEPHLKLKFKTGDVINIIQLDDGGWWLGELNGDKGWVPAQYFEPPA